MSHSVHPYSHRLATIRGWQSRWFALPRRRPGGPGQYQQYLKADISLREYLEKRLRGFFVDRVEIERGGTVSASVSYDIGLGGLPLLNAVDITVRSSHSEQVDPYRSREAVHR